MYYILFYKTVDNYVERRAPYRPAPGQGRPCFMRAARRT
jgi:hypothetical protein